MKRISIVIILFYLSAGATLSQQDFTKYVDPFIGTGSHGHTYPGATLPFGMVQLSPDTRNDGSWDGCGGYHHSDSAIIGFSHTHLSGTGVSDLGDILLMPITGEPSLDPGTRENPSSGYRTLFSHESEVAEPGYYSVYLDDYNVKAELTAGKRVGYHRYTFDEPGNVNFLIDLIHRDPVTESFITFSDSNTIEGYRRSKYWAGDQHQYFVMEFSKPIESSKIFEDKIETSSHKTAEGRALQALVLFHINKGEQIEVKVALSAVSIEGARINLIAEGTNQDFDVVRKKASEIWNTHLSKIEVKGGSLAQKRTFYTALYHCLLTPNLYQDVDGLYRGMDGKVHKADGFTNYTVFSLWDTFRALHPLLTIIEPEQTADFVKTLVNMSKLYGELPMWELAANDTRCMIGYHAVSVIADAYAKGITNFNLNDAFKEMKKTALLDKRGLRDYRILGYVPSNKSSQGVSKTLEYAYDDWCIANIAKAVGKTDDHNYFLLRSKFYENVFDKSTGFMRGKNSNNKWVEPFDSGSPGYNYTEGNSFQYSLFVPHDIEGMTKLLGGKDSLTTWLDKLFATYMEEDLGDETDISGLIGQYAHGNEPSHHIAYLYSYSSQPWKTQPIVRRIMNEMYNDTPSGLCGNEDCGQMSAWYVFSAMGFYPVTPGSSYYVLGSPLFDKIIIHGSNGQEFTIRTKDNSPVNQYISAIDLNGNKFNGIHIDHKTITTGGELTFHMTDKPDYSFGKDVPETADKFNPSQVVYLDSPIQQFLDSMNVELKCDDQSARIFYTLDGSVPTQESSEYIEPFTINESAILKTRSYTQSRAPGYISEYKLKRSKSLTEVEVKDLKPGLNYNYYEGIYRSVYDFALDEPVKSGITERPNLDVCKRNEWIGLEFDGLINIPADGEYTFYMSANDGCQLVIDDEEQFESDARKSVAFVQQSTIQLTKGLHKITIKFYQCTDNIALTTEWKQPGKQMTDIPASVFFTR